MFIFTYEYSYNMKIFLFNLFAYFVEGGRWAVAPIEATYINIYNQYCPRRSDKHKVIYFVNVHDTVDAISRKQTLC